MAVMRAENHIEESKKGKSHDSEGTGSNAILLDCESSHQDLAC